MAAPADDARQFVGLNAREAQKALETELTEHPVDETPNDEAPLENTVEQSADQEAAQVYDENAAQDIAIAGDEIVGADAQVPEIVAQGDAPEAQVLAGGDATRDAQAEGTEVKDDASESTRPQTNRAHYRRSPKL